MNEAKEQELREINSRLAIVFDLWREGKTQKSAFETHTRAKSALDSCVNERTDQFILLGDDKRAIGTVRVARLLECIKAVELRLAMNRKEPRQEVTELLQRKHDLLESLLFS